MGAGEVDGGSILWGRHRGAGMEGSAAVAAEDTVAGERCPLVWRDDKMPWGQPCPVAGTLLGVAKDHSLCDHFPHLGAQALESTHGWVGGVGWPGLHLWVQQPPGSASTQSPARAFKPGN